MRPCANKVMPPLTWAFKKVDPSCLPSHGKKMMANGALCLSTPKHNGKSGTRSNKRKKSTFPYSVHDKFSGGKTIYIFPLLILRLT